MDFRETSYRSATTPAAPPARESNHPILDAETDGRTLSLAGSDVRMMLLDGQVVWRVWDHAEQRYVYMDSPPKPQDRRKQARRASDHAQVSETPPSRLAGQTAIAMTG